MTLPPAPSAVFDPTGDGDGSRRRLVVVTNFNRNFTGVSATAAQATANMTGAFDLFVCGRPLPGCPAPVSVAEARRMTRLARPPAIWHVRRNSEMRAALIARDLLRLPMRIVFTSAAQRRHSAFPRWLISRMDAVIATTPAAAQFVGKVRAVAPHGVDVDVFRPAGDRAAVWAAGGFPGAMGIATVGRVRPEKGTDVFVEAMIAALPRLPGATALVIGKAAREDAAFAARLRARVDVAGLSQRILFIGEMEPERLRALLPGLSLLIAAPRYEGYGMTVLEAMAAGVPAIATRTGYFEAFVEEGVTGHTVPIEAGGAIARRATALLGDPVRVEAFGAAARRRACERFSIGGEVDAIRSVYEAIWAEASSPG